MPSGIYIHKKGYKRPPMSLEQRKKLSLALKGQDAWNKGKRTGPNPEHSKRMKGKTPWNKGKVGSCPHSDEWKKKVSETLKKIGLRPPLHKGSDCHLWQGGKSFKVYSGDWTKTLKRSIRERDKYICQICNK